MNAVFLDTVGLLAVWDTSDQWHDAAEAAYRRLISLRQSVMTTTFVLLECGNAAARRTYREDVCALRRTLELRGELIIPTPEDWKSAWESYEAERPRGAGIVDHASFAVMRRLGLTTAFTNDWHYRRAGFDVLF